MSGHTPGPWRFLAPSPFSKPAVIRGKEGGFQVIGLSPERECADARLIAAAPDLLEALEELLEVFEANLISEWSSPREEWVGVGGSERAGLKAISVVARAKGEKS